MRARVLPRFGEPELFEARDVPVPTPGPGQVLVRVIATILGFSGDISSAFDPRNPALHGVFLTRERRQMEEMTVLIENKQMRPLVERVLPLEQVAEAHRQLDSGHGRGRIVRSVSRK
ncbi:zinc-binding dehydrogenase [Corallococcus sp. EGB]|uniref:zinc-binding dehydrogenase n=1 Tax=Corallococcus sp. EGB TaxID=1521117 RepID=UPI001CC15F9E|nr:zinc-binding dehydrogenase [Corallococcus sp. EGB]